MVSRTSVAAAFIGRTVTDARGRRIGRVVAIVHKTHGIDALVDGRRWLVHHSHRFDVDDLVCADDGTLVVASAPVGDTRNVNTMVGVASGRRGSVR